MKCRSEPRCLARRTNKLGAKYSPHNSGRFASAGVLDAAVDTISQCLQARRKLGVTGCGDHGLLCVQTP
jgi:hypothetical protein